jgi:hypothetical protein
MTIHSVKEPRITPANDKAGVGKRPSAKSIFLGAPRETALSRHRQDYCLDTRIAQAAGQIDPRSPGDSLFTPVRRLRRGADVGRTHRPSLAAKKSCAPSARRKELLLIESPVNSGNRAPLEAATHLFTGELRRRSPAVEKTAFEDQSSSVCLAVLRTSSRVVTPRHAFWIPST